MFLISPLFLFQVIDIYYLNGKQLFDMCHKAKI